MPPKWGLLHSHIKHMLCELLFGGHPSDPEERLLDHWYKDWIRGLEQAAEDCEKGPKP